MGQPRQSDVWRPAAEYIGRTGGSRGTETSQYLDEEKSTEIPLVVASERGTAQTSPFRRAGVVGPTGASPVAHPKVLEGTTKDGESPVGDARAGLVLGS
jgi:hypothetical protein